MLISGVSMAPEYQDYDDEEVIERVVNKFIEVGVI